jgi:hypothetical protein
MMDGAKVLVSSCAVLVNKVATFYSLFEPDLLCSGMIREIIHVIGERIWCNSEKLFNNPLLLERTCFQGRWRAVNNQKFLNPSPSEAKPRFTACHSPFSGAHM